MISVRNALVVMTPSGCGFQLINNNYFIHSIFSSGKGTTTLPIIHKHFCTGQVQVPLCLQAPTYLDFSSPQNIRDRSMVLLESGISNLHSPHV